ncbi:GGDEF domain-containing protein [Vibrio albus]|nr:GGDEF domain-containing protein [Vibrio albus]
MIREPDAPRKAKPFFVSFFLTSAIIILLLSVVPTFHSPLEHKIMDIFFILNIAVLSIGMAVRFQKYFIERVYYIFLFFYLIFHMTGPYYLILPVIFGIINSIFIIWLILTRQPKPNRADFGLIVTLLMWFSVLLFDLSNHISHDHQDFLSKLMLTNLIFAPAFIFGVGIFLLASYMMDSNILLERLASKDELTDMLNRRALFEKITAQIDYLKRKNQPASIIIADIDYFKKINDSYGHDAGDEAIRHFSSIIKGVIRNYDISARYGGEEFIIFLPGVNTDTALTVAERIRSQCESNVLSYKENNIYFTASFGVSEFQFDKRPDVSINIADQALYTSKHTGRNRVSLK